MLLKTYSRHVMSLERLLIKTMHQNPKTTSFYHNVSVNEEVSSVTLSEMKQKLKSVSSPCIEGHACIVTNFSLCEDIKQKECKIYINKMTGMFQLLFI